MVLITQTKMLVIMTISIEMLQILDIQTLAMVLMLSSQQTFMIKKIIKLWEMIRKRYRKNRSLKTLLKIILCSKRSRTHNFLPRSSMIKEAYKRWSSSADIHNLRYLWMSKCSPNRSSLLSLYGAQEENLSLKKLASAQMKKTPKLRIIKISN